MEALRYVDTVVFDKTGTITTGEFYVSKINIYDKKYTKDKVLELCDNPNIEGLSILGGEPMHPKNIEGTKELAKAFKEKYPEKNVWLWSGYTFEKDLKDKEALKYVDVLVDGQYVDALHNPTLEWRGSSNQRVINVPESLKENKTVLRKIAQ